MRAIHHFHKTVNLTFPRGKYFLKLCSNAIMVYSNYTSDMEHILFFSKKTNFTFKKIYKNNYICDTKYH
jgi:hypothetical protein